MTFWTLLALWFVVAVVFGLFAGAFAHAGGADHE